MKSGLIPLIEKIKSKPSPNKEFLKDKKYDVDVQVKLNHQIAKDLGFDLVSLFLLLLITINTINFFPPNFFFQFFFFENFMKNFMGNAYQKKLIITKMNSW